MTQRERRLGAREPVEGMTVGWRIDRHKSRRLLRKAVNETGELVDVSVSGAAIIAPSDPELDVGSRVLVSIDGGPGIVVIHRVMPTDDSGSSRYGVAFGELSPRASRCVNSLLEVSRPDNLDEVWSRAR